MAWEADTAGSTQLLENCLAKMGNFHFPFAGDIWRGRFCQQLQDRSSDLRTNILGSERLWHIAGNCSTLGREIFWAHEKEGFSSASQSLQIILASSHTIYHLGQRFTTPQSALFLAFFSLTKCSCLCKPHSSEVTELAWVNPPSARAEVLMFE